METVKRMIMVGSALFLLVSTLAFNSFSVVKDQTKEVGFIVKLSVTFCNKGTENWNFTEEDRTISLFMNNTWQTVQLINHSHPLEKTTIDEDRNPITVLQFTNMELKPGENTNYTVTYSALSKPRLLPNIEEENSGTLEKIPERLKKSYCGEGDPWLVNDPELQDLAQNITENETKVLTVVKKFVEWIRQNIRYPAQAHEIPLYPNETYAKHSGDCDDQAILFVTLCRICEIPSYVQVGCMYMTTEVNETYWEGHLTTALKHIGWHGWAMAYIPPWGWLPVDLTWWHHNPLNAIKKAAVTSKTTLQYMNISQMDYVASVRKEMDFLKNNDFYIYTHDEMMEAPPTNHGENTLKRLSTWIFIIATVAVAVTIAGISMHVWKKKKLKEFESNSSLTFRA